MATLTVGQTTFTRTINMTNANAGRLIAWAKAQYGSGTDAEAFTAMADGVFSGLRANVRMHERAAAARNAEAGVPDIEFS
ncbi:MAG: hypothetical protein AB7H90_03450 [Alphaproteobacteria bacterium]